MRKFLAGLKGWRGFALIAYMWLILMAWAFLYVDLTSPEVRRKFYAFSVAEIILLALVFICPKLLDWAARVKLVPDAEDIQNHKSKVFFMSWLICFAFFFVMYLIFYPGGLNPDNVGQYSQALNGSYNDANPVLQTLFAYTLPLKLSGGWFGSINLFQLTIFSLVIAYTTLTLYEYGSRKYAKWTLMYMLLNPETYCMAITPLKDSSFAIAALLLMSFAVRIYFTKGEWLKNILHAGLFVGVLAADTLFRHNAILFTLPLLFAVSLYVKRKKALMIIICSAGLICLVRYPVYSMLNVNRSLDNRQIEALGLPMTIIGNAVKEAPEKFDKDILDFAYSVAPHEVWEKHFDVYHQYDRIKLLRHRKTEEEQAAAKLIDNYAIERAGWKKVIALALKCLKEAPMPSFTALISATYDVYGIAGPPRGSSQPSVAENSYGIKQNSSFRLDFIADIINRIAKAPEGMDSYIKSGRFSLQGLITALNYAVMLLFKHLFWHVGVLNLAVIVFTLARLKFSTPHDWKRLCLVLPMLAYNYGTMLVMPVPLVRYFYSAFLLISPVLLVLLKDNCHG